MFRRGEYVKLTETRDGKSIELKTSCSPKFIIMSVEALVTAIMQEEYLSKEDMTTFLQMLIEWVNKDEE